jgi:long-chain acyl-CoA synthetase
MNYCTPLFAIDGSERDHPAFVDVESGVTITFKGLRRRVQALASYLTRRGVSTKSTVAIHLYNSIDAIVVHMAAQYIGAVSCFIDALAQPKSLGYYIRETGARMLVTHLPEHQIPAEILGSTIVMRNQDLAKIEATQETLSEGGGPRIHSWDRDEVCYVYYTSGTTSAPKGVMLTQGNHENFFKITDRYWQPVSAQSRHICFVPFSHGFGSIFLVPLTLRTRATLLILRAFHPQRVVDAIETYGVTHIYGVPSHYQQLLRLEGNHPTLRKLQMAFCAASKLEQDTTERWQTIVGIPLNEGYGLIETCCGIVWRVGDVCRGTGHVGVCPAPSLIEIGILDGENRLLPAGETGEIAVRGPSVMKGYLNKAEETDRVFVDGWFKTGDKGYLSTDHHLFMTGRIKDIINIAGIKVSPYEVEEVLNGHTGVAQTVAVAAEDALYGETVKAYVQRQPGATVTERELIRYAAQHLISFQVPKTVEFVESFPLNNLGKIDRNRLRAAAKDQRTA